ncbi:hypothetical protein GCM10011608_54730 [Micromonospora sonchi]|uniref:Carboxypeptidase regulatory-like domain-containing protein n=1 Tax=Micromonospora sonchi TaxID=1763543 RepID=A0A917U6Q4_9ACTN|nr:hypothetical protein [Micromonospora sonchi]GGM62620.1 hypothetical protein GCM10011608_54730 [Micromonospora sonchi]
MDDEHAGPETPAPGADDRLLASLGDLIRAEDAPPAVAVELAKQSFGLRQVDTELAALVADSAADAVGTAVRAGEGGTVPRLLTFEFEGPTETGEPQAVEVEVSRSGRYRRLLGQLQPPGPARIEVRQPEGDAVRQVDADDQGRFVVEVVGVGLMRLTWYRPGRNAITTAWVRLD